MRIGLVTENHFPRLGGMERQNHALACALAAMPDTHVAASTAPMPEVPRDFPYPYPVYRGRSLSLLTPWLTRRAHRAMVQCEQPEVLYGAMLHGGGYRAVRLGRRLGLPVAVSSHGADLQQVPEIGYGARLNPDLKARVEHALRNADLVSVPSELLREAAIEHGAAPERVVVIPPGVATEAIGEVPFEDTRARFGIPADAFLIVSVGRNRPIKRLHLLMEALEILKSDGVPVRCVCLGPAQDLPELVTSRDLEDVVVLAGPIGPAAEPGCGAPSHTGLAPPPDLVNLYRAADAYVSTSHVEAFGLSALEALACGTPAVVMDTHGVRDVIVQGRSGMIVSDHSGAGGAAAIQALIQSPDRPGRAEVAATVAHLTWEHMAQEVVAALSDLVDAGRSVI